MRGTIYILCSFEMKKMKLTKMRELWSIKISNRENYGI